MSDAFYMHRFFCAFWLGELENECVIVFVIPKRSLWFRSKDCRFCVNL